MQTLLDIAPPPRAEIDAADPEPAPSLASIGLEQVPGVASLLEHEMSPLALVCADGCSGQVVSGLRLFEGSFEVPDGYPSSKRANIIADEQGREPFFELVQGQYLSGHSLRGEAQDDHTGFYQKMCIHIALGSRVGGVSEFTVAGWFDVAPEFVEQSVAEVDLWLDNPVTLPDCPSEYSTQRYSELAKLAGVIGSVTSKTKATCLLTNHDGPLTGGGPGLVVAQLEGLSDPDSGLLGQDGKPVLEYRVVSPLGPSSSLDEATVALTELQALVVKRLGRKINVGQGTLFS